MLVTDFELCYALMASCYLGECLLLVPDASVLFSRALERWRINRLPGCAFAGKRLVLAHPLPWCGEWHSAPSPDATPTEIGLLTINSLHDYPRGFAPPRLLAYAREEAKSRLEDFVLAGCPLDVMLDTTSASKDSLPAVAAAFALWTDARTVRESLARLRGLSVLKILCGAQFIWAFVGAPALLRGFSPVQALPLFLLALFCLGGFIAVQFAAMHKRLHGRSWKAFGRALWLFVYPPAAMRAVQIICAGAVPPRHESALAQALLRPPGENPDVGGEKNGGGPQPEKNNAAARYLADMTAKLRHRLFSLSLSEEHSLALARANEALIAAVHASWGLPSPPADHAVPRDHAASAVCFCPVCGVSLARREEYCPHCAQVRLLPLSGAGAKRRGTVQKISHIQ
jgi:hypothetical protein